MMAPQALLRSQRKVRSVGVFFLDKKGKPPSHKELGHSNLCGQEAL